MKFLAKITILSLCFINRMGTPVIAQEYPYDITQYSFINEQKNRIEFRGNSWDRYEDLFKKLSKIILFGNGQINIVHIGDSHIQADFFPAEMRYRIISLAPGLNAGRGFIFPYKVAKTNNPDNYKVEYTGNWDRCRNVESDKSCNLGLAGLNVSSYDSIMSIKITLNTGFKPSFDFNKVKVFINLKQTPYSVDCDKDKASFTYEEDLNNNLIEYKFDNYYSDITFTFIKTDTLKIPLEVYGFYFYSDESGILYSSLGVNGSTVSAFNRCKLMQEQLKVVKPDLVIISLGTNEAFGKNFDANAFKSNYDSLLKTIRLANPSVAVLLTGPGDCYKSKRYPNYNIPLVRDALRETGDKNDVAVWDFFSVMGGLNSINAWYHTGMASKDKVHLVAKGYTYQGDLLFTAFLKAFDKFIDAQLNPITNPENR